MSQKQHPVSLKKAIEGMSDMYDLLLKYFEEDEAVAILVGLNQSRFNKFLPEIKIPTDDEPATP